MKRCFALLLLLCLLALPFPALAENADTAADADSFTQWIEAHRETGGTLRLSADITLSGYLPLYTTEPVSIDTNGHTISLATPSYVLFDGPFTITDQGDGVLLFDVAEGAQLDLRAGASLYAAGNAAVAVRTHWRQALIGAYPQIEVSGRGAAAVMAEGDLTLSQMNLTASGAGALCLNATTGNVEAAFSLLAAHAGALAAAGDVTLDVCAVTGDVGSAAVIPASARHFVLQGDALNRDRLYVAASDAPRLPAAIGLLTTGDGLDDLSLTVNWTADASAAQLATPGTYTITGTLDLPDAIAALLPAEAFAMTVTAVDGTIPYLTPPARFGTSTCTVDFFTNPGVDSTVTLYTSQDGGATWQVTLPFHHEDGSYLSVDNRGLRFKNAFAPGSTVLAYVSVTASASGGISGVSNVLTITVAKDGSLAIDGDRDLSDWNAPPKGDTPAEVPDTASDSTKTDAATAAEQALSPTVFYDTATLVQMADSGTLRFYSDDGALLVAEAPADSLEAAMADGIDVELTALGNSRYRVVLRRADGTVIDFSDTPLTLRLRYDLREGESVGDLSFISDDGVAATITGYEADSGQLVIALTHCGTYTLQSSFQAAEAETSTRLPIAAGIGAVAAASVAGFVLWRVGKQKGGAS